MSARGIVVCENCDTRLLYKIKDNTVREINMITLFNRTKNRHAVRLIRRRCDAFFDRHIDMGEREGRNVHNPRDIGAREQEKQEREREREKDDARRDRVRRETDRSVGRLVHKRDGERKRAKKRRGEVCKREKEKERK